MHRLAVFDHDVVGDINNVVDRTDTGAAQALAHPLGGRRDLDVAHHSRGVAQAQILGLHIYVQKRREVALRAALDDRLVVLHRNVERRRRLTGKADEAVAVGTVVGDLEFHDGIVASDDLVDVLTDGAALVVQDPDAVGIGLRAVVLGKTQLLIGAEHAVRLHAAKLALRDVNAAGQVGVMERGGNQIALMDVLRAGDDLKRLVFAHIDHADPHVVGVFVALHGKHLADDDVPDLRVHAGGGLDLLTGDGHGLVIFLIRGLNVNELTEPFSRNIHCVILLLRTATGSEYRFRRSCAGH